MYNPDAGWVTLTSMPWRSPKALVYCLGIYYLTATLAMSFGHEMVISVNTHKTLHAYIYICLHTVKTFGLFLRIKARSRQSLRFPPQWQSAGSGTSSPRLGSQLAAGQSSPAKFFPLPLLILLTHVPTPLCPN